MTKISMKLKILLNFRKTFDISDDCGELSTCVQLQKPIKILIRYFEKL